MLLPISDAASTTRSPGYAICVNELPLPALGAFAVAPRLLDLDRHAFEPAPILQRDFEQVPWEGNRLDGVPRLPRQNTEPVVRHLPACGQEPGKLPLCYCCQFACGRKFCYCSQCHLFTVVYESHAE